MYHWTRAQHIVSIRFSMQIACGYKWLVISLGKDTHKSTESLSKFSGIHVQTDSMNENDNEGREIKNAKSYAYS